MKASLASSLIPTSLFPETVLGSLGISYDDEDDATNEVVANDDMKKVKAEKMKQDKKIRFLESFQAGLETYWESSTLVSSYKSLPLSDDDLLIEDSKIDL